jgi:hypothetical protein
VDNDTDIWIRCTNGLCVRMCLMKQTVMLLILAFVASGCMATAPYGYRDYDPCISCGENWSFYPNETGGAQATINRITDCEHNWNCSK